MGTGKMDKAAMQKQAWKDSVEKALWQGREKSLAEFASGTTFHGVKYIFDASPIRRFLWLACWMTAIGLFVYQVSQRIVEYQKHPTNVDVKIIYNNSVLFPSVTICNQNQFRFRSAAELNMYDLLDAIYSTNKPGEVNVASYDYPRSGDVDEVFSQLAHKKLDFIAKWSYRDCDRDMDFTMVTTDMGYCYTFNMANDTSSTLSVVEPGIRAGLRLVLNVEQYEYMRGPHSDAGVKVYLHDHKTFPMVTDMGFSVAPGTHTVASAKMIEVTNLGPPYSTCVEDAAPITNCRLECLTRQAVEVCGCRDVYMPEHLGNASVPLCDMDRKLVCITELMNEQQDSNNCTCFQPCHRSGFEVSLSNAELSSFNVDRAVIRDSKHAEKVENDFHASLEISEKVIRQNVENNEKHMGEVKDVFEQIRLLLTDAETTNSSNLAVKIKSLDMNSTGNEAIKNDLDKINAQADKLDWVAKNLWPDMQIIMKGEEDIREIYEYMHWQGGAMVEFRDALAACIEKQNNFIAPSLLPGQPVAVQDPENYFTIPECIDMNDLILEVKAKCGDLMKLDIAFAYHSWFLKLNSTVENIFEDSYKAIPEEHSKCLENLYAINASWVPALTNMIDAYIAIHNGSDIAQVVLELTDGLVGRDLKDDQWVRVDTQPCNWLKDVLHEDDSYDIAIRSVPDIKASLDDLMLYYKNLMDIYGVTWRLVRQDILPTINLLDWYFFANLTKLQLTTPFIDVMFSESVTSLLFEASSLEKLASKIEETVNRLGQLIATITEKLQKFPVPIIKEKEMKNLTLVTSLLAIDVTDEISNLLNTVVEVQPQQTTDAWGKIMIKTIEEFYLSLSSVANNFIELTRQASVKVDVLKTDLSAYKAKAQLNQDFYLHNFLMLDIYYNELSYERIIQQRAFQFLSLLGEVGGFLGLLLGASVLTVCEVLDYVVSHCIACAKRRREVHDNDPANMKNFPL